MAPSSPFSTNLLHYERFSKFDVSRTALIVIFIILGIAVFLVTMAIFTTLIRTIRELRRSRQEEASSEQEESPEHEVWAILPKVGDDHFLRRHRNWVIAPCRVRYILKYYGLTRS